MRRRDLFTLPATLALGAPPRRGIALNEDNSHFFFTRAGRALTEADVDALVDQYAGTQVRELMLSANSMRTSYGSKVWDPVWRGYDPAKGEDQPLFASLAPAARANARKWVHTAWDLDRRGIDVYARWIARARKHGIAPWLSMRMNDIHEVQDERSYMHSEFWRANPKLRRVPYRDGFREKAFDYGHAEVRAHHMKLVRELAGRYDADGLELDWMRFGFHFRPGQEQRGAGLLTAFVREAREVTRAAARRRGHPVKLGARVPSRPHTAVGLGMDAVRWAREGLIDMLVITPFWASIEPDMPVELWKQLLAGTGVELAAGLEVLIRPYHDYPDPPLNSLETARAAAATLLDRGADRVYLFNYMDSQTAMADLDNYPKLLREVGEPETLRGKRRRHVLTYSDTWAPGEPSAPPMLPVEARQGRWAAFRLPTGPKPERAASVTLGVDGGEWEVRLNGELCAETGPVTMPVPAPKSPTRSWRAPLDAVNRGYNLVEVLAKAPGRITWVELTID